MLCGQKRFIPWQASPRGGLVQVRLDGRMMTVGQAVTVLMGELLAGGLFGGGVESQAHLRRPVAVATLTFQVAYRSVYGAYVNSIDGLPDGFSPGHYWMLYVDGVAFDKGVSESLVFEDDTVERPDRVEARRTNGRRPSAGGWSHEGAHKSRPTERTGGRLATGLEGDVMDNRRSVRPGRSDYFGTDGATGPRTEQGINPILIAFRPAAAALWNR